MDGDAARDQFDDLCDEMEDRYQPRGALEAILVQKIVVAAWRLKRLLRFEQRSTYEAELAEKRFYQKWSTTHEGRTNNRPEALRKAGVDGLRIPDHEEMLLLIRYEAAANRDLYRAIGELRKVQADRRRHGQAETDAQGAEKLSSTGEPPSDDAASDLEKQNYQTNPNDPVTNESEAVAERTDGESPPPGLSSG